MGTKTDELVLLNSENIEEYFYVGLRIKYIPRTGDLSPFEGKIFTVTALSPSPYHRISFHDEELTYSWCFDRPPYDVWYGINLRRPIQQGDWMSKWQR